MTRHVVLVPGNAGRAVTWDDNSKSIPVTWDGNSTPADMSAQLSKKGCPETGSAEAVSMKAEDYRGIVGSLLYITKQTLPDRLATVTQLSRFLENTGRVHWVAAKRVLLYPKGSKDL